MSTPTITPPPTVGSAAALGGHGRDTRTTDPTTSHEARDSISVEALAESQQEVLAILQVYGPQADHDILTLHELRHGLGQTGFKLSGSRLRTARKELVTLGRVEKTDGSAITETGRRADVWGVA